MNERFKDNGIPLCKKRARLCKVLEDKHRIENLRAEEEMTMRIVEKEKVMHRQMQ